MLFKVLEEKKIFLNEKIFHARLKESMTGLTQRRNLYLYFIFL